MSKNLGLCNINNWSPAELVQIAGGPVSIEVCPTFISPWEQMWWPYTKLSEYNEKLKDSGVTIIGIQSILYGLDYQLTEKITPELKKHFRRLEMVCNTWQTKYIVVGCPKNRLTGPSYFANIYHFSKNIEFFAELFKDDDVTILLEAICGDKILFTTYNHIIQCVKWLGFPNIKVLIDTASIYKDGNQLDIIRDNKDTIGHVHLNFERPVLPEYFSLLTELEYDGTISIEYNSPNIEDIKASYKWAKEKL